MLYGITHYVPLSLLRLWRKILCRKGWHLFDEVVGYTCEPEHDVIERYLYCDACDLIVRIDSIDDTYVEK